MLWHAWGWKTNNFTTSASLSKHKTLQYRTRSEKIQLEDSVLIQINKSPCCFMRVRTIVMYKTVVASIYHAMCQYFWLLMLCGVISQHTFSPLKKVEECHGVSEHQRQPVTSLHCTRTCTSANWFSPAGTCPRQQTTNASMNRTVKSAYCTILLSHQISIQNL